MDIQPYDFPAGPEGDSARLAFISNQAAILTRLSETLQHNRVQSLRMLDYVTAQVQVATVLLGDDIDQSILMQQDMDEATRTCMMYAGQASVIEMQINSLLAMLDLPGWKEDPEEIRTMCKTVSFWNLHVLKPTIGIANYYANMVNVAFTTKLEPFTEGFNKANYSGLVEPARQILEKREANNKQDPSIKSIDDDIGDI